MFFPAQYFGLLRNYRRYGWLSCTCRQLAAVADRSCVDASTTLKEFAPATLYEPYATSLRMSDLGYRNKSQASVQISVNSLEEYVRDLSSAVSTPLPEYQASA